jgi:pimeloyl-ACP methyl ester carboxylesterase
VGGSEGAMLATQVASFVPETTKLVLLAGGIGWRMRDELLYSLRKRLNASGTNSADVDQEVKKMNDAFSEAKLNPTSTKTVFGKTNTYKWWNSVIDLQLVNLALDIQVPILMVHGTIDDEVPIESARALVSKFKELGKTNLSYQEFDGLDHHWNDKDGISHTNEVLGVVFNWLFTN